MTVERECQVSKRVGCGVREGVAVFLGGRDDEAGCQGERGWPDEGCGPVCSTGSSESFCWCVERERGRGLLSDPGLMRRQLSWDFHQSEAVSLIRGLIRNPSQL